jgi:hypothetical protein
VLRPANGQRRNPASAFLIIVATLLPDRPLICSIAGLRGSGRIPLIRTFPLDGTIQASPAKAPPRNALHHR